MTRTAEAANIVAGSGSLQMLRVFADREEAGRALAERLGGWRALPDCLVLGLPRGGVPVAFEIARALELPLDVLVVRKLGLPWQPELAMGAIASGGALVVNDEVLRYLPRGGDEFESVRVREQRELERREREFRGERPPLDPRGKAVILVDDGLATGATMEAAVRSMQSLGARRVVVAVPVASAEARDRVAAIADEVVCLETPVMFSAVGQWYRNFDQTADAEVTALLERSQRSGCAASDDGDRP